MARALVLVGHGSSRNPNTRLPLDRIANEIRARGGYDEVCCGFLKEEQRICKILSPLKSDEITVVPFFISDGYYTQNVIPACLRKNSNISDSSIRYTQAVGSHPLFADLCLKHAQTAGWERGDALVILGHGTPRNPASGRNIYLQAERIRQQFPREEIITAFIDEAPFVTDAWTLCRAARIFIVPLFVGDGWHVTETIPEDLGLINGRAELAGRTLLMTSAVGTDPGLVDVVLTLAGNVDILS
ncbi:CbiX/SirB N-terminal domain-containing protein [Kiritimatiellaeota bacterium B1221]|nr:CbiX/SirB N-terminal domain-containing protein [Kiritimatiellaeota bacterium B1221]